MPTHVCFTKLLREEKFTRHRKFILRSAEFLLELHFLFSKQRLCILFEYFVTLGSLVEWKLEFWRFIKGMRGHYPEKHVFGEYIERRGKESLWKKNSSSMRLAFILDSMLSYTRKNNNLHIKKKKSSSRYLKSCLVALFSYWVNHSTLCTTDSVPETFLVHNFFFHAHKNLSCG